MQATQVHRGTGAPACEPVFGEAVRRLTLRETVTVADLPGGPATLDLWYPVVADGACQNVLDVTIESDSLLQPGHDPDYGNPMRHLRLQGRLPRQVGFRVDYLVYRVNRAPLGDAEARPRPVEGPGRGLEAGPGWPHAGGLGRLARSLVGDERDGLRRAAILLDRARLQPGSALARARFLVDLYRSACCPARLVAGHRPGRVAHRDGLELCPHFWTEVFVSESGWLHADPSCPPEGDSPFRLGLDHVVRSRGDDLLLLPVQRGPRLPAFCETYAEVNGRRHPVTTRLVMGCEREEPVPPAQLRASARSGLAELLRGELPRLTPAPGVVRLSRGATLSLASCEGQWLFLLLDGQVRVSRLSPAGRKLELGLYDAPELFTGGRLLHGFGEAVRDSVLVGLSREQVMQIASRRLEFGSLVLETLSDRLLESDERMEYLAYHSLASRVAMALLRLCDAEGVVDGMTHQQIGDIVGAYRETVTKVLHEFKRGGLVRLAHRRIELLNPLALTKLLDA
jgi:CRP/FNR family transcriptional regulator, cyclic AMP receptor protein